MKHSEGRFTGCEGRSIYYQCWEPESGIRAVLLVAHGAGEHSGRYQSFARYFSGYGYAVAALDHNGHGHSDGRPGHVERFGDYLDDLENFHAEVAARFSKLPVFLVGHSMGGLIVGNYLLRHQDQFKGAILSGAAIKTDLEPGAIQLGLIKLLAVLTPRLGALQLDASGVSRDAGEVRKYIEDPLVHHGKMSMRMLRELFSGMNAIQAAACEITLPMLILHGEEDVMTAPQGSRFLHQQVRSNDKTLKVYPELYHEIFNEPEREEVLADVLNWCEQRLQGS